MAASVQPRPSTGIARTNSISLSEPIKRFLEASEIHRRQTDFLVCPWFPRILLNDCFRSSNGILEFPLGAPKRSLTLQHHEIARLDCIRLVKQRLGFL